MHLLKQKFVLSILTIALIGFVFFIASSARAACNFHNVTGYVWSGHTGWISLNCSAGGNIDYGLDISFESQSPIVDVTGYAWSSNLGWLNFDPVGIPVGIYPIYGAARYDAEFARNTGISPTTTSGVIKGWAQWEALGDDGWMIMGPINISSTDYGVSIGADRLFYGWSWNGGEDVDSDNFAELGDGWVRWDSEVEGGIGGGASVLAYWFETLYGDIYSGGDIQAPFAPPLDKYNATYLIQANGTIQPVSITSKQGAGIPEIAESFNSLLLPDVANNYRGTLAWLDKAGMIAGRYGTPESTLPAVSSILLDGKVYHYTGSLTIANDLIINKGVGSQKGSGTIIVDGNLTIDANISYQSGSIGTRVENLPSVAWIVKGDIIIDEDVTNLVGVFFSEGSISTGTKGVSLRDLEVPLQIDGMLIANQINLERLFADETGDPAEQIKFDGRAIVNPPPGLADIGKGLPILRETRP
ncbi:hypothetical protein CL632_03925 [bacterium]|nr:hypothetical protein [bacterium]MDP6571812.1 hypothetical protein [Patescibacteria group bacterium]|tara:strand:- start:1630 stop:3042 length:1413 start_codon:yes stop_codon:yes gene_type:complete